jgi:hypothetical protein
MNPKMTIALSGAVAVLMPTSSKADLTVHGNRPTERISCSEALRIFGVIASQENKRGDIVLLAPPNFPNAVLRTQTGASKLIRATQHSNIWWKGWFGRAPATNLVRRWYAAPFRSIGICFRKGDEPQRVGSLVGWVGQRRSNKKESAFNIRATYPVTDAAHSHALILYSKSAAPGLGGSSELLLLARTGTKWRIVGSRIQALY